MRKSKVLFWLVIIILILNIGILILSKTGVINNLLNDYAVEFLSKQLDSEISFENLTLSDKQVIVNGIQIDSNVGDYQLNVEQLVVDYKLIGILPIFNRKYRPFNEITAVAPEFIFSYRIPEVMHEQNSELRIPDLGEYFGNLTIIDGSIRYTIEKYNNGEQEVYLTDQISSISAIIEATRDKLSLQLTAVQRDGGSLEADAKVYKGEIEEINAKIDHFLPAELTTTYLDEMDFVVDLDGRYYHNAKTDSTYYLVNADVHDAYITRENHTLYFPNAQAQLVDNDLKVLIKKMNADEIAGESIFTINKVFSGSPTVSGKLNINSFNPAIFTDQVTGLIDGNFVVTGALNSPELYGEVRADVLTWNNQSVSDLKTKIILNSNDIEIELDKAVYLGNEISGKGTFSDFADLNLMLSVKPSEDEEQAIDISSKIEASLHFDNKVTGIVLFNDTGYIDGDKNFNGLSGYVDIRRDSLEFKLEQSDDMFSAEGKLNILTMDGSADVDFKNIILNDYYQNSDIGFLSSINLNGRTSVILENNKLFGDISLRIVDVANILYDSRIKADVQYDFKNYRGELSAQTKSSLFNDRPFSAELEVSSYRDSIIVRNLSINDQLSISGWMNIMDGFTYGFKVRGEDIDIKDVLKYELTTYQMNQFTGVVDLDIDINSRNDKKAEGVVQVENFSLGVVKPISARATISGSNEYIDLDNVFLDSTISDELLVNGFVDLRNGITFNAGATFTDLEVSEVLSTDIKGLVSGKCEIEFASSQTNKPTLSAVVSSSKLDAYGFRLNRVHADASQYADSLVFNELILVSKKKLDLDLQGALGYNILNGETSVVNNTLNVTLNSDIAQILKSLKLAEKGDVPMELKAELTMSEDGLSFENGSFKIKDGRVNVETQLQELSSINVDISILDNEVDFKRFDLRSGASKLYIRNEIANDEKDLILGLLRIGKLYVKTGKTGIHVSVPQYSQENSLTNAIIKGRNTNEAVIEGPFDDLHIEADVILRNAMALYPPKVDNLLKLFSQLNPLIKRKEIAIPPILPFKMDVVLYFDENSRYITYPANIPVKENSFVHLIYNGEIWEVKQILINADSGTFDFFGINFKVDFFEVGINEYSGEYLLGELYHKTSEGTTIFLSIDTDDDLTKSFADRLIFNITSDNPNDYTTMNILARLRYDSDLADLSSEQQGAIWQDQALNLLEGNLNSYYLDPILFPVENSIRKFFKLDFLYVDFGFLQNVYSNYVINEKDAIKREESELVEFSSSILLDNLKINAGKYLTRNIYLDYTALFQETTDLETKTNIIVHHDTTFRVNLPYKFKVSYSFGIKPDEDEIYSHEVMLQRSIRFDFNNYKYHRKNRRRYAIQPIN